MARRFDQYYRVKPRDNLGDPEYWNRRFDDIDRRVSSNEDGLDEIGGLTAYVEGLALNRLDLVLAPALDKITLVSQQGFLLAHSDSSIKLDVNTTQTFAIPDLAERELFAPSPFVTIVREANTTDYAFAKLVSYDKTAGQLVLQPIQIWGNSGPFDDWLIYVGTAVSEAVKAMMDTAQEARDTAVSNAASTSADRTAVATAKTDALSARDTAVAAAAAAQTWDPSNYSTTAEMSAELVKRLRIDINNQGLSGTEQGNGRTNLGLGNAAVKNTATAAKINANTGTDVITTDQAWAAAGWTNLGNLTGAVTLDANNGSKFYGTLTGNVTITIANLKNGQQIDYAFLQDATGGRTISWPVGAGFPSSTVPAVLTTANAWALFGSIFALPSFTLVTGMHL
jgi:hypothetical protein